MPKVLYHLQKGYEPNEIGMPSAVLIPQEVCFVDGNGRKYTIPYDEPTVIESDFMAGKIVEHCHWSGIIFVNQTPTRTGVEYDMKDAKVRALKAFDVATDTCIKDYIYTQLQDRVRQNFPPLPPDGRALQSCIIRRYNLLRAGIRCVGWEPPYEMDDPGLQATASMAGAGTMQTQITQLQTQLLQQNEILLQLLQQKAPAAAKGKGKQMVASPEPEHEIVDTESEANSVNV